MSETDRITSPSAVTASIALRTVIVRLRRRLVTVVGHDDLTPSQASALMRIRREGVSTASSLAVAENVRPQSMSATLAALAERDLVSRRPDPTDGRRQMLELTEAGRQATEGVRAAGKEWLTTELERRFTEPERQQIITALALLERLIA